MIGARWMQCSGEPVAKAYLKLARTRNATSVTLVYKSKGWFLEDISRSIIFKQGGSGHLILTQAQADRAHRLFGKQFSIY